MKNPSIEDIMRRCKGLEIRPLNLNDYSEHMNKDRPRNSIRGYIFFMDGEYIANAGVEYRPDGFYVFSDIKENAKVNKHTIYRCARFIIGIVDSMNKVVTASSDINNESAHRFVEGLGFSRYGDDSDFAYFYKGGGV